MSIERSLPQRVTESSSLLGRQTPRLIDRDGRESSRRRFLAGSLAAGVGTCVRGAFPGSASAEEKPARKAQIAITLDLEMSRNFPTWETTHWDYEKGNLDEPTKAYAAEACRRVAKRGGKIHCFCVGRVLEQENVDWLEGIVEAGHPVGNHTYDHVYVLATKPEELQYRFRRAPWLIQGKRPSEVITENIRLTDLALKDRLGIRSAGFRTPGGFTRGLQGRPDVQRMLLDLGFEWVSSKYPAHPMNKPGEAPSREVLDGIVAAQKGAQPFVYPTGLIEVPMSPISDIGAFRGGRWKLESFLEAIRESMASIIEQGAVFDFLAHPSCLTVTDPKFRTIDMICDMVEQSQGRAELVTLDALAQRAKRDAK